MEIHRIALQQGPERVFMTGQAGHGNSWSQASRTERYWSQARTRCGVILGTGRRVVGGVYEQTKSGDPEHGKSLDAKVVCDGVHIGKTPVGDTK